MTTAREVAGDTPKMNAYLQSERPLSRECKNSCTVFVSPLLIEYSFSLFYNSSTPMIACNTPMI